MSAPHLRLMDVPTLSDATMLLALSGWMDGGMVSTGTVSRLLRDGHAQRIASIDPDPFYIYNFPGAMEVTALFRPHCRVAGGLVRELDLPANEFHCDARRNIVFFLGREPNLLWQSFGDCIWELAARASVRRILFIGSFGGSVPHTREPRLYASVSDPSLRPLVQQYGVQFSDYEGPASFTTYLMAHAPSHHLHMISLVAEIPAYLQGANPLSIEAVTRRLARILNLPVNLDALRQASNEWETQVSAAVAKDPELASTVRQLEEQYDNQLIESADSPNP